MHFLLLLLLMVLEKKIMAEFKEKRYIGIWNSKIGNRKRIGIYSLGNKNKKLTLLI